MIRKTTPTPSERLKTRFTKTLSVLISGWSILLLLISIGSPSNLKAQTFTNNMVATGYGSSNVFSDLAVNPVDGKFYVLWKYGNFVNATYPSTPYFQLRRWEPSTSTWAVVGSFDQTTIPNQFVSTATLNYTMYNDNMSLEIDASGNYHVAFSNYTTTNAGATILETVTYATSTNGTSWAFTVLENDNFIVNYSFSKTILKLDNNNRPHICFKVDDVSSATPAIGNRFDRIRHYAYNGSSWAGETALQTTIVSGTSVDDILDFDFTIDASNKLHIAAGVEYNGGGTNASLVYFNNTSGSWSAPTTLILGAVGAAASNKVNIVLDNSGKVHILNRNSVYLFQHLTNASGSWVTTTIANTGEIDQSWMTKNAGGDIFAMYNERNATNTGVVKYACLFSGASSWQTGAVMTGNNRTGQFGSVAFNNSRVAMLCFDHFTNPGGTGSPSYGPTANPRQLQYATATVLPPGGGQSISTSAVSTTICAGAAINVPYTISGTFNAGNVFTAQLSNSSGSFASPVSIGTLTTTAAGTIAGTIPSNTTSGTGYRIRVISSNPSVTGTDNGSNITVNTAPTAGITGTTTGCGSVSLTATGGTSYAWSNSTNTATATFTTSGTYTVTVTGTGGCTATASAVVTINTAPTAGITGTTTACGSVSLTATGGTGYAWSNGTNTAAATFTTSGTYSVTVTNAAGCTASTSANVIINTAPSAGITGTTTGCGSVSLTATGGTSYLWSNSTNTAAATFTTSGTYSVTVTNAAGCTASTSANVTVNTAPTAGITGTTTGCGSVSLTATGGTAYAWSNSTNTAAATFTTSGTYTVTVTNAAGCTASTSANVTVNTAPTAGITGTTTGCGSVSLTATGGTAYAWSNSTNTAAATFTTSGTYTVTVTGTGGCTASTSANVTVNTAPTAGITGASTDCGSVTLTATGGTSYAWSNGGTLANTIFTSSGIYTVTVTNAAGCTASTSVNVTVNTFPTVNITGTTTGCGSVTLTATGGTGYAWSNGTNTAAATFTTSGAYSVTVTNAAGCTASTSANVTINTAPTSGITGTTTACGSVTLTATGGTAYAWSNSTNTATATFTASGTYTVTVTNAAGCTASTSANVTVNTAPTAGITGTTTSCGSVSLTATGGTGYAWSNGTNTAAATFTTSGTYSVSVTNAAGCTASTSTNVTVNVIPTAGITGTTTACSSVTLTATGGTAYAWSNGANTAAATFTSSGTYSVTVTNAAGCTASTSAVVTVTTSGTNTTTISACDSYTWAVNGTTYTASGTYSFATGCNTEVLVLTINNSPTAGITGTTTDCGSVNLTATGGATYAWSNGANTAAATFTTSGTYNVTVTNAAGCSASTSAIVTVNTVPTAGITGTTTGCGSVTLTATGGTGYAWSDGTNTDVATFTASGTYSVTVTNAAGCTASTSANVSVSNPEINIQSNNDNIASGDVNTSTTDHTYFGSIPVSTSLTYTYTIQNTGTTALNISSINITGTDAAQFTLGTTPTSVAAGGSASFTITFTAPAVGLFSAQVNIANNDCDESAYFFAIEGSGNNSCAVPSFTACPTAQSANTNTCTATVNYTATAAGTSPTLSYTFAGATVASGAGTGSGAAFNIGSTLVTITATNACGSATCSFFVTVNAPEMNVKGNGSSILDNNITPTAGNFTDFGLVNVGSSNVKAFVIENTGNFNLNIASINIAGTNAAEFVLTSVPSLPAAIAANGSITFSVTYTPSATGIRTATVNIGNDDCNEGLYNFDLSGQDFTTAAALDFDGVNDEVALTAVIPTGSSYTKEVWINTRSTANKNILGSSGNTLWLNAGVLKAGNGGNNAVVADPNAFALNTWTHVAVTYDAPSKIMVLYKNGIAVATATNVPNYTGGAMAIGNNYPGVGGGFRYNGILDEVRIWNRALTAAEINNNMSCEIPTAGAGLLANYHFNQGIPAGTNTTVTSATDYSSNANTGTLSGLALTGTTSNWVTPGGVTSGTACGVFSAPEINVTGNNLTILDGDNTPSASDKTIVGTVTIPATVAQSFVIQNTGNSPLTVSSISLTGTDAASFSIAATATPFTIAAGGNAIFTLTFAPATAGTKSATVQISNDDSDEATYDFAVQGTALAAPVVASCLDFDAANDEIAIGTLIPSGSSYTKEAWVLARSASNKNILGSNGNTLWIGTNLKAGNGNNNTAVIDPSPFPLNTWTHVAVTYDAPSKTMTLYKNGLVVATNTNAPNYTGGAMAIGNNYPTVNGYRFSGKMDEVRIWNRALCATEITNNMSCEIPTTSAGLLANYHFNQGLAASNNTTETSLLDLSGNNNNGTLSGFALSGTASNWVAAGAVTTGTSCTPISIPEINVQGNATNIVSNDITPSLTDHTNFGSIISTGSVVRTYTIQNTGTAALNVNSITMSGTDAALFTVGGISLPAVINSNANTSFTVTFAPASLGLKTAALTINNDDCNEAAYSFAIQGTGSVSFAGNALRTATEAVAQSDDNKIDHLDVFATEVYPNPFQASFIVKVTTDENQRGDAQINLLDLTGRIVHSEQVQLIDGETSFTIDGTALPAGQYFLQLSNGKKTLVRKLVKVD